MQAVVAALTRLLIKSKLGRLLLQTYYVGHKVSDLLGLEQVKGHFWHARVQRWKQNSSIDLLFGTK
jgi:hypothetical protein